MYNYYLAVRILHILKDIRGTINHSPKSLYEFDSTKGICGNLTQNLTLSENILKYKIIESLFKKYPHYSGNVRFPLPGGSSAYHADSDNNLLWENVYRLELLDFMIDELEKYVGSYTGTLSKLLIDTHTKYKNFVNTYGTQAITIIQWFVIIVAVIAFALSMVYLY